EVYNYCTNIPSQGSTKTAPIRPSRNNRQNHLHGGDNVPR
ncbi:unnamed protein product, partial [Rotaria sordida]